MATSKAIEAEVIETKALTVRPPAQLEERSVEEVLAHVEKIQLLMKSALVDGEHYGVIPGTGGNDPKKPPKKTLLQPGAQKLGFMFRLIPEYIITRHDLPAGHREYEVRCELIHAPTGTSCGQGVGSCSTMESKYRWRKSERECPSCGNDTIKRSKFADKTTGDKGWYCYAKIGGCGAEFRSDDQGITEQETGRKENPDIADVYNTVLKIGKKRAFVDATITATAAGDLFTQDLEDTAEPKAEGEPAEEEKPKTRTAAPKQQPTKKTNGDAAPSELTGGQYNELWKRAVACAEKTGGTREVIVQDVLAFLKLESVGAIKAADFDRVLQMVAQWEPGINYAESE